jgi:formylglycine-generating enzyme required for sulfatase activity
MGNNPSVVKGDALPVHNVSWNDVQEYLRRLSARSDGVVYRLPTEAEWEYACRAGSNTAYSFGDDSTNLSEYAWYGGNSGGKPQAVGNRKPNGFDLYDMHGNVYEWCQDTFHDNYDAAPANGSAWAGGNTLRRMARGGSYLSPAVVCRSAARNMWDPSVRKGCRLRISRSA